MTDKEIIDSLKEKNAKLKARYAKLKAKKKGTWQDDSKAKSGFVCSVCASEPMYSPQGKNGYGYVTLTQYCPHCGAEMDWGDE